MKKLLLSCVCLLAIAPLSARAETMNIGSGYAGIGGGLVVPSSRSVSGSATGFNGSGDLHFKNGATGSLMAGYHFNDYLAGEVALGYGSYGYDHLSGSVTVTGLGTAVGNVNASGHDHVTLGIANVILTPVHGLSFVPYIGGGIGVGRINSTLDTLSANGATATENASNSKTGLALDGILGADVPLANGFSLGGRYQYVWLDSSDTATVDNVPVKLGDSKSNVFTVRATFKF